MFTLEYGIFLLITVIIYYISPQRFQKIEILIVSFVFLGYLSITFLVYALGFSTINFLFGQLIEKQKSKSKKKVLYYSALLFDIGTLFLFKYINLIIESINYFTNLFGDRNSLPLFSLILPIGISYYTFQSIGYIYRVFKGLDPAEKSFINYSIYTLFFPKILAGPIELSNKFLPQLHKKVVYKDENISVGLRLILLGFLKKLVIADNIGIVVNTVNGNFHDYNGFTIVLVFLLQPLYMYFDFSGYTDIALGSARLLGYNLTDNFNRPFFAPNITTFWRRWHISLTAWCHDFIFNIVLYKRRRWKDWGAVYAVFLTFIVIGIWHGPSINYLIVGLIQAFAISFEYLARKQRHFFFKNYSPIFSKNLGRIITYLMFSFTLIFFNLPSPSDAINFMGNMFDFQSNTIELHLLFESNTKLVVIPFILIVYFITEALQENKFSVLLWFNKRNIVLRYAFYYLLIYLIIWFGGAQQEFIYFKF